MGNKYDFFEFISSFIKDKYSQRGNIKDWSLSYDLHTRIGDESKAIISTMSNEDISDSAFLEFCSHNIFLKDIVAFLQDYNVDDRVTLVHIARGAADKI